MLFGINPIAHSNLKVQLEDLKKENMKLVEENKKLDHATKVYQEQLVGELSKASFSVDWEAMNAFSVERGWGNGVLRTTIGYLLQEPSVHTESDGNQNITYKDVVREWVFNCSAAEHERLVSEFNEYVKGNK